MADLRTFLSVIIGTLDALALWVIVRLVNHPRPWATLSEALRPMAMKSIIA